MKTKLLLETIERMGVVSYTDLQRQMGAAQGTLAEPLAALLQNREIAYSLFLRGEESFHSRAFLFCLHTVLPGAELSPPAQALYDQLCDAPGKTTAELRGGPEASRMEGAFRELAGAARILPVAALCSHSGKAARFDASAELRWATDEQWLEGLRRPARCADLGYCVSTLRGALLPYFSTREIQSFLYGGGTSHPSGP